MLRCPDEGERGDTCLGERAQVGPGGCGKLTGGGECSVPSFSYQSPADEDNFHVQNSEQILKIQMPGSSNQHTRL